MLKRKGFYVTHAEVRCEERYGVKLGMIGMREIRNLIGGKESMFVRFCDFCEVWDVYWSGRIFRLIFDQRNGKIVTFLPPCKYAQPKDKQIFNFRERLEIAKSVLRYAFWGPLDPAR